MQTLAAKRLEKKRQDAGAIAQYDPNDPWREDPLPLWEFTKQHLGIELWPNQRKDLETFLGSTTEDAKKLFTQDNPTPYNCGILCYGKGSGKDFISTIALVWFAHILLCMRSPSEFLGLEKSEAIDLAFASPTLRQTSRITFAKFKNRFKEWQWFRDRLPVWGITDPDKYLKTVTEPADYIKLPCNIRIHNLPLNTSAAEGFNILAFTLSEYAAMESEAGSESATAVFQTFISSGKTRYRKAWKGFIASFPRSYNDPQEKLIEEASRGLFPELFVIRRPSWEVHPNRTYDDFASEFKRNPEDAWAKYGAQPRAAIDAYFRSPELIPLHCSGAPMSILKKYLPDLPEEQLEAIANLSQNPITSVDEYGDPLLDRRGFPKLASWFRGQKNPAGEPYEYFCHLDPGLSGDGFGFAMGHLHQFKEGFQPVIDLAFRWTGRMFRDFGTIKRMSWFIGMPEMEENVSAAEVDFRTVREFIFFLQQARGFTLGLVTFDRWNSAESVQELRKRDIPVGLRTVAIADYNEFKSLVYNRQLHYYGWPVLIDECYKLQLINGTKVEAPRTRKGDGQDLDSHKDVSDCVATVTWRLSSMRETGIDFYQSPEVEDIFDRFSKKEDDSKTLLTLGGASDTQQKIMREFFDEG